jgi:hypothetical protein
MNLLLDGLGVPVLSLLFLFFGVTAVLWLLLPFSIFGIKSRLDEQLRVLRSLDARFERLERSQMGRDQRPPRPDQSAAGPIDPGAGSSFAEGEPSQPVVMDDVASSAATVAPDAHSRWQKPRVGGGG